MTEVEWLTATDPKPMLEFLNEKVSDRKLQLCAVSCVRSLGDADREVKIRTEAAERFADKRLNVEEVRRYWFAREGQQSWPEIPSMWLGEMANGVDGWGSSPLLETMVLYLRDIFGNPFHPVTIDRSWLTSTVLSLATGIYEQKAFDRMPILADALQDAGCHSEELLNHWRQPGEHVRGCWVVDLILGKK